MLFGDNIRARCVEKDGRLYVGVTTAMQLVKQLLGEESDSYGPAALSRIHCAEGSGCHAVCLDWLAHAHGLLPEFVPPAWPSDVHPDEARWHNVMANALTGFQAFCEEYAVVPIGIEQEAFSAAYGLVGHVDLYCELTWMKKRRRAVIDLKFCASLMESHKIQLRCYSKLDGIKDAQIGLLYQSNRNIGDWKLKQVDLTTGLDDVAAVANAARLFSWAEQKGR